MRIMPISTQQNSQPNFTGYVGKDIKKIITKATKTVIKDEYLAALKNNRPIDMEKLMAIKNESHKLLENLNSFMAKFHEDTYLTLPKSYEYDFVLRNGKLIEHDFVLRNNKLKNSQRTLQAQVLSMEFEGNELDSKYDGHYILDSLKDASEYLNKYVTYQKDFDKDLFLSYANDAPNVLFSMRRAKKADKLAPEFGVETGWVEKTKQILEERKISKAKRKQTTKENKKTFNSFLKNLGL